MPTRAINLKLIVPRGHRGKGETAALWTSHRETNVGTRYYETRLLAMRQATYLTAEGTVEEKKVKAQAEALLDEARQRNRHEPLSDKSEALLLLRQLYEAMVPAVVGKKGNSQAAGAFVSPLTDPRSKGFLSVFEKIKDPPNWVEGVRDGEAEAFDAAYAWLNSATGRERLQATGAPPKWVRLFRDGDRMWPLAFVEDLDKKRKEVEGTPTIMMRMRELGVLPLFPPYFASRIGESRGAVTPWDRLAMRLAVGHLLSWESWCIRAADEHNKRVTRVETFKQKNITDVLQDKIDLLRGYERTRTTELQSITRLGDDIDFRISERQVRGWEDLREKWLKIPDASPDDLVDVISKEQTRLRGRFGDPHLFRWLARDDNRVIWRDGSVDPVRTIATLNAMERLVERSRETALMTLPEPRLHPRSAQWEPKGGANLRNFVIRADTDGFVRVDLPLLKANEDNTLEEETITFDLAPSSQMQDLSLKAEGKKTRLTYTQSSGERLAASVGSADLMMKWTYLRNREPAVVEAGDIGPAYLKLALDVDPVLPDGFDGKTPRASYHFQTAAGKTTKYHEDVREGLRVLSVDLGVRTFGSCSVFELRSTRPAKGLYYEIPDLRMFAVHERSFMLELPDEDVGRRGRAWQEQVEDDMARLRRSLGRYRRLRNLAVVEDKVDRSAAVEGLSEAVAHEGWPFEPTLLANLKPAIGQADRVWTNTIEVAQREWLAQFGPIVRNWRKRDRNRDTEKRLGKSLWAVEHLTRVRRFLMSWSLIGRVSGEIRRLDREKRGVFAGRLLGHINAVKDDHTKTGADLLVQAARGYRRDQDGQWVQSYDPCHIILFEDLSRYRMRIDRPRRENSQLMKWSHRAIRHETEMQAELYGIHAADTGAAFSSRYHAASGTPGVRVRTMKAKDLNDTFLLERIAEENPGLDLSSVKSGDLVPLSGGDVFCCLSPHGLVRLQADINAAQNLQRRFWTRHSNAFRIVVGSVTVGGEEIWVPKRLGERLRGALGGYGQLTPTGHQSGSCRWETLSRAKWARLAGEATGELSEDETEELAGLEEEALERSGQIVVFFRDPSGIVLPADLWYPAKTFWSIVKARTTSALRKSEHAA